MPSNSDDMAPGEADSIGEDDLGLDYESCVGNPDLDKEEECKALQI